MRISNKQLKFMNKLGLMDFSITAGFDEEIAIDFTHVAADINELKKQRDNLAKAVHYWKKYAETKDEMLAAYRTQRPPSATTWNKLEWLRKHKPENADFK